MPAVSIAMLNQKGGVGKTSTTYHLAGTLAKEGRSVLCLDMDPQASLTQAFIGPDGMRSLPSHATLAGLFGDGMIPTPDELIRVSDYPGISYVPSSGHLTRFNVPEPHLVPRDQQLAIRDFVDEVRGDFDVILIDNPPNLHLCAWATLCAADWLVTPLQAEDFGSQGIAAILDCVEAVQAGPNPSLRVAGFLLTMFNPRLAIHKAYETMLRQLYPDLVFASTVPIGTDFKEAVAGRKPIAFHKPKGASAKSIKALADELMARVCTVQDAGEPGAIEGVAA